jgi:hypothetical protein
VLKSRQSDKHPVRRARFFFQLNAGLLTRRGLAASIIDEQDYCFLGDGNVEGNIQLHKILNIKG